MSSRGLGHEYRQLQYPVALAINHLWFEFWRGLAPDHKLTTRGLSLLAVHAKENYAGMNHFAERA